MDFNPFLYKNGKDFLDKTKMTPQEAINFLDHELKERERKKID